MADPNSPDGPKGIYVLPQADVSGIKRKFIDVPYAYISVFQKLDIYLPETGAGPYPVIVSVHGGAWMMCDKNDVQLSPALKALDEGFAVVSVNYRLSGEAKFPAQIHDVKAAIRWIRAHAADYGLDPDRIAVWGGSAGGHLSELAGTSTGTDAGSVYLEDPSLGNPDESCAVDAVVAWFAPTDFLKMDVYFNETGAGTADHGDPDSPESRLLGRHIVTVPDMVAAANPETYVHPMMPPFFLQHGIADPIVPFQHSVAFAEKIRKVRGDAGVKLDLIPGAKHGGSPEFETPENISRVISFIRDSLDKALAEKHFRAAVFEIIPAEALSGQLMRRGIKIARVSAANPFSDASASLGVASGDCLALCATSAGLEAAKAAGMRTVAGMDGARAAGADPAIPGYDRFVADRFFRRITV